MRSIIPILVLSIFLSSCNEQGSLSPEYFVDDVKSVEYLTLSFCIDESGNTHNINTDDAKTTYKNQKRINEIVEQIGKLEFAKNNRLIGGCTGRTFRFVNEKYKDDIVSNSDCEDYGVFKTGEFKYKSIHFPNTIVTRAANRQIERDGDLEFVYIITWKSPCEYTLIYESVSDEKLMYLLGKTINVKILDVLENGDYVYRSNLLNRTVVTGVMKKI